MNFKTFLTVKRKVNKKQLLFWNGNLQKHVAFHHGVMVAQFKGDLLGSSMTVNGLTWLVSRLS